MDKITDLEAKTMISEQLTGLLQAVSLLDSNSGLYVSIKTNEDKEVDIHLEDPQLLKVIRDYVYSKAKILDVNFKMTGF